jgi:hypothetical protein
MSREKNNGVVGDLSYFSAKLRNYLHEIHPGLTGDEDFIERRSDAALDEYSTAIYEGANRLDAMERANTVLYSGLRFSCYEMLCRIVAEWFEEVSDDKRTLLCRQLLPLCGEIFDRYEIDDDFDMSVAYQDMQYELTGMIQEYIERHGVQ